jgi:drug/metabolite transporter (DMT)-like permease
MLGALLFLPFFLIWEFAHFKAQTPVLQPYILLTLLAIFPSTIAFILLTITVRQIGVVRANIFTNLIPIFTGVLSFFIIGEKFTSIKIIAIIIVILGLFLSQLHRVNLNFLKKGSA